MAIFRLCVTGPLAAALFAPAAALAHGNGDGHHLWTLDPWVLLPLAAFVVLYARGLQVLHGRQRRLRASGKWAIAAMVGALAALFPALIWPLDALAEASFAAHMGQHMLLIAVVAPLLVYAEPSVPLLHAAPALRRVLYLPGLRRLLRILLRPRVAFAMHTAVIWGWHAPVIFELGVRNDFVHALGHLAFLGSALLFWAALRQAGRAGGNGYGVAALAALGTLMHMGILGGLITFAPRVLYGVYEDNGLSWLTPLEDQQLAGLIMWVPAALPYVVAGLGFVMAWLRDADQDRKGRNGLKNNRNNGSKSGLAAVSPDR